MHNRINQSLRNFVFELLAPYKRWLSAMALIGLCWALINTFTPYMLKVIIDQVLDFKGDKAALLKTTLPSLCIYIALWLALSLNMRLLDWVYLKLFPNLREDIMCKMFSYLNQHSHLYFQNNFAGSLVNKITDMQGGIINILTNLDDMFAQTLGLVVAIITLYFVHPIFALILLLWALAFLLITSMFLKSIQVLSHVFAESKTTVVGKMVDSISNIINVRLFARHREENQYIHNSIKDTVEKDRTMQAKIIKMRIFWDISIIFLMSLNLFVLLHMYSQNLVSIGDFTFVMSLSVSVLWNLWFIASQFVSFSEQIGISKQALSIISAPHDIVDAPHTNPLLISQGRIQFHDVTFHYDEGAHLFRNKNIIIPAAQKVGLVGFSGSGKSTFVNLILRLFEVESGEITIDNQNINQVTQKSLRENIALIPQDITLFHRSLMENIRFGHMRATDSEVFEIAKKTHCHEFISQLAQGYDTIVGERGIKLSTGQRQRIAIARAMLKNAPILILDEATSALDSITEKYIQDALDLLMVNKTAIVIAHRLSTLAKMHRILVFDQGEIIEDGSHDELLTKQGHYAKMWQMQAGGFLPQIAE